MAEEPLEAVFGSCLLEVLAPDTSVSFPEDVGADGWLDGTRQPRAQRKQAFFDEQLDLLLLVRVKHPLLNDPHDPPVSFLGHVQISLEASYIPQTPIQDAPDTASLIPPRSSSVAVGHTPPSIYPPNTPTPIPSSNESDRKYVQSEGTLLFSGIWGAKRTSDEPREKFALLFSQSESCWIAVYQLSLIVSYLRLSFSDPLLCLTASATLRDKSLSPSQSAHPLVAYLVRSGMISRLDPGVVTAGEEGEGDRGIPDTGFEEVNLLEGLTLSSSIPSEPGPLHFPSTRLGTATRQRLFSLPAVSTPARTPPSTSRQTPTHILRRSYRKVLQAVSGFRVRMRTVFIPHVLLPKGPHTSENDQDADQDGFHEEREAGNVERTVVLCVEVENSGESGPGMGFSLERLDVKIGGEGATTRLIGWGEGAFNLDTENQLFPLLIGSMEQYNLLYVVSFWNAPNDQESLLLSGQIQGTRGDGELQRAVTITVYGRPYLTSELVDGNDVLSYPTQTFSSRWNCILDLSSRPREETADETAVAGRSALPEPASPFPGRTALSSLCSPLATAKPTPQAIAGKRHTLPGSMTALRAIHPPTNFRLSLPHREYPGGSPALSAIGYSSPPVALQVSKRPTPTTFGMPSSVAGGFSGTTFVTPPSPCFPALPTNMAANTPHAQAWGAQRGYSGPSVEIKRERGTGMMAAVPQTPLPTVINAPFDHRQEPFPTPSGEPIVVSVGLLPAEPGDTYPLAERKIYPSNQFTLDIFVYNQSSWTRRFEVSYPNADRRQRKIEQYKSARGSRRKGNLADLKASIAPPGILPLQNRVRVGPLKPSTCQSVRMDFLAISPGVHSVDILTLTDIESGYAVHLRSVMDIVVHERIVEEAEEAKVP